MALSNLTKVQTVGVGSNIEVVGVITTGQFKSGTSNLHSTGVELTNLNVSGIATIGGNLSIGGTLTYQDVTNIDSVGLITARAGINVSGGQLDVGSNIKLGNAGVITATSFVGSGANLTNLDASDLASGTIPTARLGSGTASSSTFLRGDSTFAAPPTQITINNNSNGRIITATGNANEVDAQTNLFFTAGSDPKLTISGTGHAQLNLTSTGGTDHTGINFGDSADINAGMIQYSNTGNAMQFHTNGSEKLRITSGGRLLIGTLTSNISGSYSAVVSTGGAGNNGGFQAHYNAGAGGGGSVTTVNAAGGGLDFWTYTGNLGSEANYNQRLRITSTGRVGINEVSPNATLHIKSADGANNRLELVHQNDAANEQNQITFKNNTTQTAYIVSGKNSSNNNLGLSFGTGSTDRMNIDSSGRVTKPNTPAFLAYHHGHDLNYGVGDTLAYMHTVYNTGNHYNTSNYTFTAPVAGRYLFSANANGNYTSGASGIPRAYWKINGSNVGNSIHLRGSDATHDGLEQRSQTVIFNLAANDTVKIVVGQNQWDLFGANSFMGYLIG